MEIQNYATEVMSRNVLTRNYFNDLADSWESKQPNERHKIEGLLGRLELDVAEKILDVGCGIGVLFPILDSLTNGKAQIMAIDSAENMAKIADENVTAKINILCGDAQYFPFSNSTFDRIIAFHVFPHIEDALLFLKESRRILKPGGELAIIHLIGSEELNKFHAELGGNVADHILPSDKQLSHLLEEQQFKILNSIDSAREYFVRGMKVI